MSGQLRVKGFSGCAVLEPLDLFHGLLSDVTVLPHASQSRYLID